jgi:hypothetical protein
MGSLAGLGVGGAVGGIVGALVGMGIPEFVAKRYEGAAKDGGTLLSVHCDTSEQIDAAKEALKETGARDISSTGEAGSDHTSGAHGTYGNLNDRDPVVIPKVATSEHLVDERAELDDRDAVVGNRGSLRT